MSAGVSGGKTSREIRYNLDTQVIGREIEIYDRLESTNDVALRCGIEGATEGKLILAEHQTAGRGRRGRIWHSSPKSSLLASLVLRHRLLANQVGLPNLMGALSIAAAIRDVVQLPATIKWPNDVMINGKKTSGVLTELEYDRHQRPFFVVGFGVNVNLLVADLPFPVRSLATSLQIESGKEVSRVEVLCAILHHLEQNYAHFKRGNTSVITEKAATFSATLGRCVRIETANETVSGRAERIDSEGRLVLRERAGRLLTFMNGEIIHMND